MRSRSGGFGHKHTQRFTVSSARVTDSISTASSFVRTTTRRRRTEQGASRQHAQEQRNAARATQSRAVHELERTERAGSTALGRGARRGVGQSRGATQEGQLGARIQKLRRRHEQGGLAPAEKHGARTKHSSCVRPWTGRWARHQGAPSRDAAIRAEGVGRRETHAENTRGWARADATPWLGVQRVGEWKSELEAERVGEQECSVGARTGVPWRDLGRENRVGEEALDASRDGRRPEAEQR